MAQQMTFAPERCLKLLRLAAPELNVTLANDRWHDVHARAELDGATAVKIAYLYVGREDRIELHLYPGDTLEQASVLYGEAERVEGLLGLEERGWNLRPNFHFGFAAKGFSSTKSRVDTVTYARYWAERVATLGSYRRADWARQIDTLIRDGIFDSADRTQFERDFIHTNRNSATPRPGFCLGELGNRETRCVTASSRSFAPCSGRRSLRSASTKSWLPSGRASGRRGARRR